MTDTTTSPAKRDNLFGVCHTLGQTFGFNPLYLRVAVALGLLVNFGATVAIYFATGAVLLLALLLSGDVRLPRFGKPGRASLI